MKALRTTVTLRSTLARLIAAGSILAIAVSLGACDAQPGANEPALARDESAHAFLDRETSEVVLPLSEYDLSDRTADLITMQAVGDIYMKRCMAENGLAFVAGPSSFDPANTIGDRPYGLWDVARASRQGFAPPEREIDKAYAAQDANGPEWQKAARTCWDKIDVDLSEILEDDATRMSSLVQRIHDQARIAAARSPEAKKADKDWARCLRDNGLEPSSEQPALTSKQSEQAPMDENGGYIDKAEEIRLATIEAQCDNKSRRTQILSDLEASYQAPLIAENQAALNEAKADKQRRLKAARDYIAQHG